MTELWVLNGEWPDQSTSPLCSSRVCCPCSMCDARLVRARGAAPSRVVQTFQRLVLELLCAVRFCAGCLHSVRGVK